MTLTRSTRQNVIIHSHVGVEQKYLMTTGWSKAEFYGIKSLKLEDSELGI